MAKKLFIFLTLLSAFISTDKLYANGYMSNSNIVRTQIKNCSINKDLSIEKMKKTLMNRYPKTNGKLMIFDITLENPRYKMVELFKQLTFYKNHKRELVPAKNIFLPRSSKKCQDIFCLSDQVFGRDLGIYYLYILDQFHFNLSHLSNPERGYTKLKRKFKNTIRYTKEELGTILKVLSLFPSRSYLNINFGYHMKRSGLYNGKTIANATINIFNLFSDISKNEQIQTIIHELGHVFADLAFKKQLDDFSNIGADSNKEWLSFSNWKVKQGKESAYSPYFAKRDDKKTNFVSKYAKKNPVEDFAETFTAYLLNPYYLKHIAPNKYIFMKEKVFGNYSFEDSNCDSSQDYIFSDEQLNNLSPEKIDFISNACFSIYTRSILSSDKGKLYRCIAKEIRGNYYFPVAQNLEQVKIELNESGHLSEIHTSLTDKLIQEIKDPIICEVQNSQLLNYLVEVKRDNVYQGEFRRLSPFLCRVTAASLRSQKKEFNLKNVKESARNIILRRMN